MQEIDKLRKRTDWKSPDSLGPDYDKVEAAVTEYSKFFAGLTAALLEEHDEAASQPEKASLVPHAKTLNAAWATIELTYKQIKDLNQPQKKLGELQDAIRAMAKTINESTMPSLVTKNQRLIAFLQFVQMKKMVAEVPTVESAIERFLSFRSEFQLLKKSEANSLKTIKAAEGNVLKEAKEIVRLQQEVQTQSDATSGMQGELSSRMATLQTTLGATCEFNKLACRNFWIGRFWFLMMTGSIACTAYLVFLLFFENVEDGWNLKALGTGWQSIASIMQRLAVLSPLLLLVKISLTKLNSCLHLRATYLHRISALTHYIAFEKAIPDDQKEAKAQLRLSLAEMIFSDPKTGMIKQVDGSELNINSVIGALGKFRPPSP